MTDSIDVCVTFDTTGSMYPCLTQCRREVGKMVYRLFKDIPDLRLAVIAHGDYCDAPRTITAMDFNSDDKKICNFINTVAPTYGGDAPECYELVLNTARTKLNWGSGRRKIIIMIGDDEPHAPSYPANKDKIDWKNEVGLLKEAGVAVYGVHAMPGCRSRSKYFYKQISELTNGYYLTLDQFSSITDLIMGSCYLQQGNEQFANYVAEVEKAGRLYRGLKYSFDRMSGLEVEEPEELPVYTTGGYREYSYRPKVKAAGELATVGEGLIPVPSGRFQVMAVDDDTAIKAFVESQGVTFKKGRGFYQLTKAVDVQQYKEIILRNKKTGDFYNGTEARKVLGLQPQTVSGGETERLRAKDLEDYEVYIQSTSVNRKLVGDTKFLYEVDDWDKVAA